MHHAPHSPTFRPWHTLRRLRLLACAITSVLFVLWRAHGGEAATRRFDIPAGPAESTLRQFSEQAGGQFIFSADKVAGVRTHSVKGQFTARDALDRLVA